MELWKRNYCRDGCCSDVLLWIRQPVVGKAAGATVDATGICI